MAVKSVRIVVQKQDQIYDPYGYLFKEEERKAEETVGKKVVLNLDEPIVGAESEMAADIRVNSRVDFTCPCCFSRHLIEFGQNVCDNRMMLGNFIGAMELRRRIWKYIGDSAFIGVHGYRCELAMIFCMSHFPVASTRFHVLRNAFPGVTWVYLPGCSYRGSVQQTVRDARYSREGNMEELFSGKKLGTFRVTTFISR